MEDLRYAGYRTVSLGPETTKCIKRFLTKFAQAMFYKHCGRRMQGMVLASHLNQWHDEHLSLLTEKILPKNPLSVSVVRNGKSLADQFTYRYNVSPDDGVLSVVVQFSPQLTWQIIAIENSFYERNRLKHPSIDDWRSLAIGLV